MRSVVEDIKERLPITDVLSSYLTLLPAGSQFKAKCPFHNERTASFHVTPERGLYYCFGCGAKGDIFTFVQEFEGVDFNGALQMLAERAGVKLTRDNFKRDDTTPLYDILEEATVLYETTLQSSPHALEYVTSRGITKETIKKFRIGYAPDAWDFFAKKCVGIKEAFAEKTGLIKKGDRGFYDRFRARIVFPITDASGRTVGFSGRMFPDSEDGPKYLNSPETELYQKSKLLFGFDKAKFDVKRRNFAILVEGQFDLVLSHQAGFTNTVATSGTALSEDVALGGASNLGTISRLTKNIILAYDGDEAGKKAMDRAARIALSLGMNPRVAALPENKDPADFIHVEGGAKWKEILQASEHVVVFQVKDLLVKNLSPHRFATAIRERVFPYLALIPSAIERSRQLELVSSTAGIPHTALAEDFNQFTATQPQPSEVPQQKIEAVIKKTPLEASALFLGILSWQSTLAEPVIDSVAYRNRMEAVTFEDNNFVLPQLEDAILAQARLYASATYANLEAAALAEVLDELLANIATTHLEGLRSRYTKELREAERVGDDARAQILLGLLHRISVRVHDLRVLDK